MLLPTVGQGEEMDQLNFAKSLFPLLGFTSLIIELAKDSEQWLPNLWLVDNLLSYQAQ